MRSKTDWYVVIVAVVAVAATAGLYLIVPGGHHQVLSDVAILAGLAFAGEGLNFLLPRSSTGSMAFIPYFALPLICPSWESVAAVVFVRTVVELRGRRAFIKQVFNTAAHALME